MTKLVGVLVTLTLLSGGCCLKADSCVENDGRIADAAVDGAAPDGSEAGLAEGGMPDPIDTRPECTGSDDCTTDEKPLCGPQGKCVACQVPEPDGLSCRQKAGGAKPACASGRCVECTNNAHCSNPLRPVCRAERCTPCGNDSECAVAPNVCLLNGSCATENDVVHAKDDRTTTCSDTAPNAGASDKPFCSLQKAVDAAVADNKPLVVLRGMRAQPQLTFNKPDTTLLIVGRELAALSPGAAGPGLSLTAGKLVVRGLTIRGSEDVGVFASGTGSELHLQQVVVTANAGGIVLDGAAFAIENTIVAKNALGSFRPQNVSIPIVFGGIVINNPPVGGTRRLVHVTVAENGGTGIVCGGAFQQVSGVALSNAPHPDALNCVAAEVTCCSGNLALSSTWRLTAQSTACLDKVQSAASLPVDIDNNKRPWPANGLSDCGAHELSNER